MSFLGGPECSTGANPLAQFQKQTASDTSLQRDRLASRNPQLNGFRSQQGLPEDAAFQDFAQQGPQFGGGEQMNGNNAFHMEQMRREAEMIGGGGGGGAWAGEFAQQGPQGHFSPDDAAAFAQARGGGSGGFNPQEFAQFRQGQMSPSQRAGSPAFAQQQQGPAFRSSPMYGGGMGMGMGMGMQRPMFGGGMGMQQPQMPEQMQGKGKGRVQELSDTDWEKQFEELSTDQTQDMDALDREAEAAIEKELDGVDR
jgi:peroxin-5